MAFHFYRQLNMMDCGPTCLRMVARNYGKHFSVEMLRERMSYSKEGVSLLSISETAESIGFRTRGVKISFDQLRAIRLPAIIHWDQHHFVVLLSLGKRTIQVADPAKGVLTYSTKEFLDHWISDHRENGSSLGIALILEPTHRFYEEEGETEKKLSWSIALDYLWQRKGKIAQVILALLFTSCLQLIFPFITQSIVDTGINTRNLQFVVIMLMAQLMLTFSQSIVEFVRSMILLKVSNIFNLQVLSDFWIKLVKLPLSYFDRHHTGDILQRIGDHRQIQNFLTGTALTTLFGTANFIVYSIVLLGYNVSLFFVFVAGSVLYFTWVQIFLKIRRKINYKNFHLSAKENNATLQMIQGMQEIRLNNAETQKRWEWENIQASLFKLSLKNLNYSQWQSAGSLLINSLQNIFLSFLVAELVIQGKLTLGAMLAVQYIIGQLSGPISQWVSFVQSFQDAKISMERLNEIHSLPDEASPAKSYLTTLPDNKSISIDNLSFTYPGSGNDPVLEDISLHIPAGKITAIVGVSGSGKTTLLKLLLKVYEQYNGSISIGAPSPGIDGQTISPRTKGIKFESINHSFWRHSCGAVLQDGFIFNDTIAGNIAVGQDTIDKDRLLYSCHIANIDSFIENLPNGFTTRLGADGVGLSQGQKQRMLIARAVYKDPEYLFFDEATNALDANNEREIVENLDRFFTKRTVVIVAHRLSTVRNADNIVVLHKGKIVEQGRHEELTSQRGYYYQLVKNQLELGN
jgi:ATP-binding cassette, subfamily B, bacterial